jgi:hypothetical protein
MSEWETAPQAGSNGRDVFEHIEDVLERYQRFVLMGSPGSGTSTMLNYIANNQIKAYRASLSDPNPTPMPFKIRLGHSDNPGSARKLIEYWWSQRGFTDNLNDYLNSGKLFLLLDGLNEMPDGFAGTATITNRATALRRFLKNYPGPAVVTCRTADYDKRLNLDQPIVKVRPLEEADIHEFARTWLREGWVNFVDQVDDDEGRKALAANPFALTMMIKLYKRNQEQLPNNREDLFNRYLGHLYGHNQQRDGSIRVQGSLKSFKKDWSELAYRIMIEGRGAQVEEDWAMKQAIGRRGKKSVQAAINLGIMERYRVHAEQNEGKKGANYTKFYHQSLYEFFCMPMIDVLSGDDEDRRKSIRFLGTLDGNVARPAVPQITTVFIEQHNAPDLKLYNASREALVKITTQIKESETGPFQRFLFLDSALRTLALYLDLWQKESYGTRLEPEAFFPARRLARRLYDDLKYINLPDQLWFDLARDFERKPDYERECGLYHQLADLLCVAVSWTYTPSNSPADIGAVRAKVHSHLPTLAEALLTKDFS